MNRFKLTLLSVCFLTSLSALPAAWAESDPAILGWIEEVAITDAKLILPAKIDTGADNSSIHATDIEYVTREGNTWVRFKLQDRAGAMVNMERQLIRMGQVKRKEGGFIERPVVHMRFCVAGQRVNAEVNLADRHHFKFPVLVGRSLLARRFLVNPDRSYLTQPICANSV